MYWETMKEDQALRSCTVVVHDEGRFCESMSEDINEVLRSWATQIKDQHPGQFMSATLLDAGIEMAKKELLQQAQSCSDPCMCAPLLPDHWLLFVCRDVLQEMERDELVRRAHERALHHARSQGRPFCADTLRAYEQRRLLEEPA